jgi:hypothetical protein
MATPAIPPTTPPTIAPVWLWVREGEAEGGEVGVVVGVTAGFATEFVFSVANFNGLGGPCLYVPNRVASAGSLQVAFLGL